MHLWRRMLDEQPAEHDRDVLSPDERNRAARFRHALHEMRFVTGRAWLRRVLSRYLQCGAEHVRFGYGPAGKPFCLGQPEGWRLAFSLSHSDGVAALAVADGEDVGLDIERVREIDAAIGALAYSPAEAAQAMALEPSERGRALLVAWTRKEACLKALGTGLQMSPAVFEFDVRDRDTPVLLRVHASAAEARCWQVLGLTPAGGFVGALARRQGDGPMTMRWMGAGAGEGRHTG